MKPLTPVFGAVWVTVFAWSSLCLGQPSTEPREPKELENLAAGPIDPYNLGSERSRFLAAAGVDSELDEKEFKANLSARDPFVRKFDSWSALKAFDKDGSNTIDWFEAEGYRRAVRELVMGAFDKDKDGVLNDAERLAANKELLAGHLPRPDAPGREGSSTRSKEGDGGGERKYTDAERAEYQKKREERQKQEQEERARKGEGDSKKRPEPVAAPAGDPSEKSPEAAAFEAIRQMDVKKDEMELLFRWDADGDGKLNEAERQAASEAVHEKTQKDMEKHLRKWDKDGDGKLSDLEAKAAQEDHRADTQKDVEKFVRKWDADHDGRLSEAERNAAVHDMREKVQKDMEKHVRKWDANGNGRLDPDEQKAAHAAYMEERKKQDERGR
ncbi:MAG: hypothetical protein WD768_19485 [Phycisphaeraceae bacterium]